MAIMDIEHIGGSAMALHEHKRLDGGRDHILGIINVDVPGDSEGHRQDTGRPANAGHCRAGCFERPAIAGVVNRHRIKKVMHYAPRRTA